MNTGKNLNVKMDTVVYLMININTILIRIKKIKIYIASKSLKLFFTYI